jgi:hypothetical protein
MLQLGFTTMFCALFIKTARLWRIFRQSTLAVTRISIKELSIWLGICISIEVIYTVAWESTTPFTTTLIVPDPLRPARNYYQCETNSTFIGFAATSLVIKGVLIIIGVILCALVRKIPDGFNEAKYIAFAIYNTLLIVLVFVPIIINGAGDREFTFYIRSFGILILSTTNCVLIFGPKVFMILTRGDQDEVKTFASTSFINVKASSRGSTIGNGTPGNTGTTASTIAISVSSLMERIKQLEDENATLRRQLANKNGREIETIEVTSVRG